MRNLFGELKGKHFLDVVRGILSSPVFPFFTAAFNMIFYYLGWDMVIIYYMGIVAIAMLLLLDDLTPLVSHFLFFHVMVTMKHSPSEKAYAPDPGYYMRAENLALIGVLLGLIVIAVVFRFAALSKLRTFKPTPVFFGLCVLAGAFLLSGLFKENYTAFDFLYGFVMAVVYLVVFVLVTSSVIPSEENYKKIGIGFVALSLLIVIELAELYLRERGAMLDEDGEIIKEMVVVGWGIWNTVGMLLVISIPAVLMLASKYKYGFVFILYATLLVVATFLSTSRQAMLGAAVVYPVSLLFVLIKSKNRKINAVTVGGIVAIGAIVVIAKWDMIIRLLGSIFDNMFDEDSVFTGNGRIRLINLAMQFFIRNPVFGSGFNLNYQDYDFTGLSFVPEFACNTFAELLAACGLVGFTAYLIHRIQTFVAFVQNPTFNKTYIAIVISGILIMSMLDNHMFNILPNVIYSALLPFAIGGTTEGKAVLPLDWINKNKADTN